MLLCLRASVSPLRTSGEVVYLINRMTVSHLSSSEQDALLAAAQVCATFSLLGSLFIIFCYARYKHLRKLSFTLVLFLAISDVGEPWGCGGQPLDRAPWPSYLRCAQFAWPGLHVLIPLEVHKSNIHASRLDNCCVPRSSSPVS